MHLQCVSFFAVPETTASGIDFSLPPSQARFRERWLYVDVGVPSPLLSHPTLPDVPNPGWGHEPLASPRLAFVWRRFESLRVHNVIAPKVVREFLLCRVAPLQRHSRRMWDFAGRGDRMRLQKEDLAPEVLQTVLWVLTGDPSPGSLQSGGVLLYLCSGRADFVKQMPSFNEWGLRPAGLTGPRKNPVVVVVPPTAPSGPSLGDRAGREPMGDEVADVEVVAPREASEATSPEAHPGAVVDARFWPSAPKAGAPEPPFVLREATPDGAPKADSSGTDNHEASSAPQANPLPRRLGRFRVDFEALRKRKEASGGSDRPCRLLKRKKYFAMDE